jgi:NAD(P)-dependent dehydrogenase (short-subunit alcohol dehydrogenase family)
LVTGAARGLGYEFCRAFIQAYGDRLFSQSLLPDHFQRGCTSIAIVDLKSSEATQAAEELTEYATCQYIENQSCILSENGSL